MFRNMKLQSLSDLIHFNIMTMQGNIVAYSKGTLWPTAREHCGLQQGNIVAYSKGALWPTAREHCGLQQGHNDAISWATRKLNDHS